MRFQINLNRHIQGVVLHDKLKLLGNGVLISTGNKLHTHISTNLVSCDHSHNSFF